MLKRKKHLIFCCNSGVLHKVFIYLEICPVSAMALCLANKLYWMELILGGVKYEMHFESNEQFVFSIHGYI